MRKNEGVPKAGVRPGPVPIGSGTGQDPKTVGQINPLFAALSFPGRVWNRVGQRDSRTKMETAAFSDGLIFQIMDPDRERIDRNTRAAA